jgi:FtsP/CotA-like multicopper oxidase with cupredoxin domain
MDKLTRRDLVAGSAAAVLAAASPPALAQQSTSTQAKTKQNIVKLECAFKDIVLNGTKVRARAYNNSIPGPAMIIHPGETLRVMVKNSLPPYDSSGWSGDHNVPHHLGSTNLHVHGLDVIPHLFEPIGTSDPKAPMIEIEPGGSKEYVFEIPRDHPPGLNWYHPHHHGSTAVQAVTGMAGGIIVKGAIDEVPEIKAAKEYLMVMQDIGLFPSETDPNVWEYLPKQNAIWQTFTSNVTIYNPATGKNEPTDLKGGFTTGDYALRYYLLNGEPFFVEKHNPTIPPSGQPAPITQQIEKVPQFTMQPGEVARFRMLNGTSDNYMPITIEGHDMHLLALDGVNFPKVRTLPPTPINDDPNNEGQIQLAPANRAEFLVKASMKPGTYKIIQLQQKQQFLLSAQKTIAEIVVAGPPKNMALPTTLPIPTREYPLIKPREVQQLKTIFFADQFPGTQNPYVGIDFTLNGQQYDVTQVNYVVDVGGVEEWHLIVGDSQHGGTEGHPFHIHVNSFEVISVNGKMLEPGTIKDTVWIPAESTVVIRMRFKEFVGKSVFHCHILPHEDTGMMQNFLIKKRGGPIPVAVLDPPMHARLRPLFVRAHGSSHM